MEKTVGEKADVCEKAKVESKETNRHHNSIIDASLFLTEQSDILFQAINAELSHMAHIIDMQFMPPRSFLVQCMCLSILHSNCIVTIVWSFS